VYLKKKKKKKKKKVVTVHSIILRVYPGIKRSGTVSYRSVLIAYLTVIISKITRRMKIMYIT